MTRRLVGGRAPRIDGGTDGGTDGGADGDGGFATVAVLALCGVLLAFGSVVASLAALAVTRHQAAAAADLAALAGAGHALEGDSVACAAARATARAHGAALRDCRLDGVDLQVTVAIRAPGVLARWGDVRARARAGPTR